jgi:YD repeat-containing protein
VFEDKRFAYDAHGNLIEKKIGAHTVQRFAYDAEHQLVEVITTRGLKTKNNPQAKSISVTACFAYDALGRRVVKESTDSLTEQKRLTRFVWDGNRLLSEVRTEVRTEVRREIANESEGERITTTKTTLYEPDSFVPMIRLDETVAPRTQQISHSDQAQNTPIPAAQNRTIPSNISAKIATQNDMLANRRAIYVAEFAPDLLICVNNA